MGTTILKQFIAVDAGGIYQQRPEVGCGLGFWVHIYGFEADQRAVHMDDSLLSSSRLTGTWRSQRRPLVTLPAYSHSANVLAAFTSTLFPQCLIPLNKKTHSSGIDKSKSNSSSSSPPDDSAYR
jgi:hypothetical protein